MQRAKVLDHLHRGRLAYRQTKGAGLNIGTILRAGMAVALAAAAPAQAEWLQATTRHFVVYSDTDAAALRRQATELERFDAIVRRFHRTAPDDDAEFNRVTVFVVPNTGVVAKLAQDRNAAGFYVPRITGSIAFTPRLGDNDGTSTSLTPQIVLFHEYAHHFLFGNYAVAYPAWFSEGYAEFASTVKQKNGFYWLGGPAMHRGYGLLTGKPLSIRQLFAPPPRLNQEQTDALYGRGWLLTHYLMFDTARQQQLGRYLNLFNAGKPSLDAAIEAFGDLKALDAKLDAYLMQRSIPAMRVPPALLGEPKVDLRPLTAGERALIGFRMESTRGVTAKTASPLYARASAAAAPFSTDAVAQGWLAEMAFDAGQLDAAEAAADRAIAADPRSSQALLYKARVHLSRLSKTKTTDPKAWTAARGSIIKANRARPNDAAALMLFYQSFLMEETPPSKGAIAGLYRATALVPQDREGRFLAARQLVLDGEVARAKGLLRGLAADPHVAADNGATRLLALLDAGRTGQAAIDALAASAKADAAGKDGGGARQ